MFDSRMTCKSFLALTIALCGLAAKAAEDTRVPFADPYVLYHDGVYYAYGTYRSNEGIGVATSRDLKSWNWWQGKAKDGFALHHGNSFGTKHYWAPEVYSRDGRFVMYHSASLHVCASVAESPLGPFRTPDLKPILPTEAIDNSLFLDDDGKAWMFYVHFDNGNIIWCAEMTPDCLHVKPGTARRILGPTEPWELVKGRVTEGPFVIKHDGTYYLTYSANDYKSHDYALGVATAASPGGPWRKSSGNPVLHRAFGLLGTGHHSFFKDAAGKWRIVFHAHNSAKEVHPRRMYIADVLFTKDKDGLPTLAVGGDLITCRMCEKQQ